jgi:predicted transcriptional regulator of viral defense system
MAPNSARSIIATLAAAAPGGVLTLEAASAALGLPSLSASRRLSSLIDDGWLTRVRRGVYAIRPLDAVPGTSIAEDDPWTVAMRVFSPCYVGGWTAAGHWHLTEQLYRATLVVTNRVVRRAEVTVGSTAFHVARERPLNLKELATVWRGNSRVLMSGVERTIMDACAHPAWVGGGSQLVAIFRAAVDDERMTPEAMLREARGATTGAALGRLGTLAERYWPGGTVVCKYAKKQRGTGYVRFDPAVKTTGRLDTAWGVWMNIKLDSSRT